ncbi:hypothetical protein TELCIR_06213 [Teladorsagia circumcincta]|uniref:Ras family protein n=1 Tax=Teladorsagia circumcincta TaxID=45464 RepID=A0A2G9UNM9_TELCI|nr:hypothetical protein TELCIR_06213 [Teladorsagia circumcincta]
MYGRGFGAGEGGKVLDLDWSVVKEGSCKSLEKSFSQRTPSPHLARTASEGMALFQSHDQMRIQTPATLSEVPTEEDDSGLVISFDDGNCSSDSDRPKGDIEPMVDSVERQIPVILVGNKCDLRAELGEVVSNHDGAALAAGVVEKGNSCREMMAVEDVDVRAAGVILSPRAKPATGCFSKCKG